MIYESDVERCLCDGAKELGGECLKAGQDGWPDRLLVLPGGTLVWCELKRQGGRLAPLQRLRIMRLRDLGHRVEVVWSKADALRLLKELA